jgi:metal-responsive CopG/Arc/MetJ family transcriptional regulator
MTVSATSRKTMITLPVSLLSQIDEAATKRRTSRSRLIRDAVESYLEEGRKSELRELLKEGYLVNAERDKRIAEEFAYADYEASMRFEWREEEE